MTWWLTVRPAGSVLLVVGRLSVGHGSIVGVLNLLLALLTLGVVGVVGALLAGFIGGGGLAAEQSTVPVRALPQGRLSGAEVSELRFAAALRGYRMDQVDAAMDRLGAELDRLRAELAEATDPISPGPPGRVGPADATAFPPLPPGEP